MKVIMAPVQMVARFDLHGNPSPARFVYDGKVIDVEQIVETREEKLAGNRMKIYSCQSEIGGELTRYEIKFELQTCKWFLYKM
ncbi:MAG: hypothetical protein AB7E31_10570 [Desulfitobacterium sp.]